jgi:inner membrane protein
VNWNGQARAFAPGARHPLLPAGVHAPLPPLSADAAPGEFSLDLALNGSGVLAFTPVGRQTDVTLRSTWADPGFTGALLPSERKLGPEGFDAAWRVSYYAREYAQQWAGDTAAPSRETLAGSAFGVGLVDVVDTYRIVERASKYGLLFIALLFTAFFLFEVLAALRLHVVHYTLVGAALVLFYLGLLSLSEFIPFASSYLAAALASTLLITLYSVSILRGGRRALVIAAALGGIYGFLYFVLQMQDQSLLAGTAALFAVLGLVMFATRKLDWGQNTPATPPPLPAE